MPSINWTTLWDYFQYSMEAPMLFNSGLFLFFFILFYGGYILLLRQFNLRILYTLLFSLFFYYKSSGVFFVLLILSTLLDFAFGHLIYRSNTKARKRLFLVLSLCTNLGLLAYFKYTNFLIGSWNSIMGSNFGFSEIFLPVGISFFTFQTLSYSIDIYRGQLVPLTEDIKDLPSFFQKLLDFGFFVCFFPQLVAGPIVRAAHFLPQIRRRPVLDKLALSQALFLIMGGLFKKAVISDYISVNYVDRIFENPALYTGFENLMAVYGYAIQIYCDFSGYSDMAIGLALLMGFRLPENFRRPYQAQSIQDFWRRWHISLSTWLRDYLYISLGGNRKGKTRTYFNLMITMLLGGLWHGASWVYVIWGGLHGIALAIDRRLKEAGKIFSNPALRSWAILALVHFVIFPVLYYRYRIGILEKEEYLSYFMGNTFTFALWTSLLLLVYVADLISGKWSTYRFSRRLSVLFVFQFISFCWIFFRAGAIGAVLPPVEATFQILAQIMGSFKAAMIGEIIQGYALVFLLILLGFLLHYLPTRLSTWMENQFTSSPLLIKSFSLALVIWLAIQTASADVVPFIYFQF